MRACTLCGKCCESYLITATQADVKKWKRGMPEMLERLGAQATSGDYFLDLSKGWLSRSETCAFLSRRDKNGCRKCKIGDMRPQACIDYPVDVEQMRNIGCEMLEPEDEGRSDEELKADLDRLRNASRQSSKE